MDQDALKQTLTSLEELSSALPSRGNVFVIPHDYPDPDAIASAAAMELLLASRFHLRGRIVFTGVVTRAENRELLRHLRYRWTPLSQVRPPKKPVPGVFLDTAPWSGNVTVPPFVRPVAVIDHHPISRRRAKPRAVFTDIRTGMGATATIMTEYLLAAEVSIPKWLASILAYAIATETLDLSRDSTPRDLDAYTALLARANFGLLGRIRHAPLPRSYFARLQEAIHNVHTYGRVAWTHLPAVENPEIVAEIADLLLRMERITWSFCTAFADDRLVVSLRSSSASARCGQILKREVGKNGSAGGHHRMAAGFLDLTRFPDRNREALREEFTREVLGRIERRSEASDEPLREMAQPLVKPPESADGET